MIDPVLEVRDLEISFADGKEKTVRASGVSFDVLPGEILGLVGESGCGKSITALSIPGLLPKRGRITGGSIRFLGQELTGLSDRQLDQLRGSQMAMIFQDIMYSLNPVLTIGSQMTEGLRLHAHMSREEARAEAIRLLEKTGIRNAARAMKQFPHQLSGGMRQRVMIAMALCLKPKLLIADEPTTALDVTIQLQIMQLLRQLRDETGMAILFISHDMGVIAELADRVVVMYAGQTVEEAPVHTLLSSPAHPYTQALLKAVPGIHASRDERLYAIPGHVPENYQGLQVCRFHDRCPYADACAGKCQPPDMRPVEQGHLARCFRPEGGVANA